MPQLLFFPFSNEFFVCFFGVFFVLFLYFLCVRLNLIISLDSVNKPKTFPKFDLMAFSDDEVTMNTLAVVIENVLFNGKSHLCRK